MPNPHINSAQDLVTPRAEIRAGFIALALEKTKESTPIVDEARALKALAADAKRAQELSAIEEIQNALMTAAGLSDKAKKYLTAADKTDAVKQFIDEFLAPEGAGFVDELVYRFLLTRGDSLGGKMRNLAGRLGERRFIRMLAATCAVGGIGVKFLDAAGGEWRDGVDNAAAARVKALSWESNAGARALVCNRSVPIVRKNVDFCLLDGALHEASNSEAQVVMAEPNKYLALGELKGGFDPAGADEHWKTANSALSRIRESFNARGAAPGTFFIGAAIESAMAEEIYRQLNTGQLSNAANLTCEKQVVALCDWLIRM